MLLPLSDRPIFTVARRELVSALRGKGPFAGLALLVATCVIDAAGRWPGDDLLVAGVASTSSAFLFWDLCFITMAGAVLVLPGFAAGSIATEREADTYDQVQLTLLRPGGVLLGKLLGALVLFVLFFVAVTPAFAAVILLVGMDVAQLLSAGCVIFVTGVTCICLGLAAGAVLPRVVGGLVTAYLLVLQYMGFPLIFASLVCQAIRELTWPNYGLQPLEGWIWSLEGLVPLRALSWAASGNLTAGRIAAFVGFSTVLSGGCLLVALGRMRRAAEPPALARGASARTSRQRRSHVFDECRNPVFERELLSAARRRWPRPAVTTLLFGLFLLGNFIPAPGGDRILPWFDIVTAFGCQMLILLCVVPAYAAPMLTRERDRGNIDALRATLLSPDAVVAGKTLGALGLMAPLLVAQLACGPPDALVDAKAGSWAALLTGYVTLAVTVLEAVCLGMVAGAFARRTVTAVVLGYLFSALAYGGLSLALIFGGLVTFVNHSDEHVILALAYLSAPLTYAFSSFMYTQSGSGLLLGGGYPGALAYWGLNVILHTAFAYACFRLAVHLFKRRNRLAS